MCGVKKIEETLSSKDDTKDGEKGEDLQLGALVIIGWWYQEPEEGSLNKKWIMGPVKTRIRGRDGIQVQKPQLESLFGQIGFKLR